MRVILIILLMLSFSAVAESRYVDTRYCGEPERYASGKIKRNTSLVRAFKRMYPLPDGYNKSKWHVDHVVPLSVGGCDSIENLQWLPVEIKSCAGTVCKDRWERKVYPKSFD